MRTMTQEATRMRQRLSGTHAVVLLLLCTMVYLWFAASRAMLVHHVRVTKTVTTTMVVRTPNRSLRGLVPQHTTDTNSPPEFLQCRGPKPGVVIPHLQPVQQWRSSRERQRESITLVTQLSLERMDMLANQCTNWSDPIAAAVYVPTVKGRITSAQDPQLNGCKLGEAVDRVSKFHNLMQLEGLCILDIELVTEDFKTEEEAALYPFNAARNRALMLAQTEALLLLDTDFLPASTLVSEYKTPEGYAEMMSQLGRRQAIVLPAFETNSSGDAGKSLAVAAVQMGKVFVVGEYLRGSLAGFQVRQYSQGHSPTNYGLWAVHDLPYAVDYKKGYEPYVIVSRRFCPWYDERFRGYGRDKISHLTHLAGLNVTFSVHPTAFVVHVPHPKAATYRATKNSGQWDKLYKLYVEVQKDVRHNRFVPVVSFPERCGKQQQRERQPQEQQQQGHAISAQE